MSLVLIGMMGAGKSTLGREAAKLAGMRFRDLDAEIEARAGRRVSEIFSQEGEQRFRELESETLRDLAAENRMVLSVGGGAPVTPGNWELLRQIGRIVYLKAEVSVLAERLRTSKVKRPLLVGKSLDEELSRLLQQRRTIYEQADVKLDVASSSRLELVERLAELARASL
jgi:shikimate kinase